MTCKKMFVLAIIFFTSALTHADDLNTKKMEKITKDILEVFTDNKIGDKSDYLRKYISNEWLDKKKLDIDKYKINNYGPDYYNILYTGGDVCIALIGGSSWSHLLVFKFTEEGANYRVVPKGISEASSDYIDPWYYVKDYLCSEKDK